MLDAMPGAMLADARSIAPEMPRTDGRTNATNARITHPPKTSLVGNRARVSSRFEVLAKNCEECATERKASA